MLAADEARQLLDAIDTRRLVGLRDKALIPLMVYTFARVSAVSAMIRPGRAPRVAVRQAIIRCAARRPWQRNRAQACLFADPRDVGLASLSVSEDEIRRWHEAGWISEQAVTGELLHDYLVEEIEFIRDIARSGLSDGQISSLLRNLGHDEFSYNGRDVAHTFRYGWDQVAEPERPDFTEFISKCADDEDEVSLDELLRAEEILKEAIAARQPDGDEEE